MDVASDSNGTDPHGDGRTEYDRFEQLTKHLVSVPKSELDERVKKAKAERKRAASRKK